MEAELVLVKGDGALEHGRRLGCLARPEQGPAALLGDESKLRVLGPEPHAIVGGKRVAEEGDGLRELAQFEKSRAKENAGGPGGLVRWPIAGRPLPRLNHSLQHLYRLRVFAELREGGGHVALQHEQVPRVPLKHLAAKFQGGREEGEGLVQPAQHLEGARLVAHRVDPARVLGREYPLVDREHAVVLLQGTGVVAHANEKVTYENGSV